TRHRPDGLRRATPSGRSATPAQTRRAARTVFFLSCHSVPHGNGLEQQSGPSCAHGNVRTA
ncbi:hypothetical protein, partial [Acetobacter persici]|uniref:hypothetical protein n=1 Tax=Acetobacter persici TaxID=1076596 RepID=UPI0039E82CE9